MFDAPAQRIQRLVGAGVIGVDDLCALIQCVVHIAHCVTTGIGLRGGVAVFIVLVGVTITQGIDHGGATVGGIVFIGGGMATRIGVTY